jgi:hypothetical protein
MKRAGNREIPIEDKEKCISIKFLLIWEIYQIAAAHSKNKLT